jgi:hypothetical protein
MILFLLWGQLTAPPMMTDSGQIAAYLICFTAPFLIAATGLLVGAYYARRSAAAAADQSQIEVPPADPPAERVPARTAAIHPPLNLETLAQSSMSHANDLPAQPPPTTPLEVEIQSYQSQGNIQGLLNVLKNPEADDKAVEAAITALTGLGFPALEALSEALDDPNRIAPIRRLRDQGADIESLLQTGIASAARYYRLRR